MDRRLLPPTPAFSVLLLLSSCLWQQLLLVSPFPSAGWDWIAQISLRIQGSLQLQFELAEYCDFSLLIEASEMLSLLYKSEKQSSARWNAEFGLSCSTNQRIIGIKGRLC
ncbi:hypothetical protein O6H91_06G130500 [Diphasiastrum complanatum]|uniref:Uncharacterized protein n=1 Tax=Diphasiastrum complanatum TaxID=34168 RepID=A0ACC2DJ47_DIPCM|nr:hypothetical protein O6H91_06G130500 [Diphasiastrum complanatum]